MSTHSDTPGIGREIHRPVGGSLKRAFDIAFSLFALLAFLPAIIVIVALHKLVDGGPVFFKHERVGFSGNKFGCLKFRSMYADADKRLADLLENDPVAREEFEKDSKLRNDPRIIPYVGRFIRSTSLDEIPQFINVLRGEMSVVGPRPIVERELAMYGSVGADYLMARPGITGLWQVSGRNDTTFEERVMLDRSYVRTWTILADIQIVLRTVYVVLLRKGAY